MPRSWSRRIRVNFREILIKLGQFKGSFITFALVIASGTVLVQNYYDLGWLEAIYQAITLMFFASDLNYPRGELILELLWIIYPILTLLILVDSLSGFGQAIRFGDPTSDEWNEEMSKLMEDHVIVVGIGNLGVRVIEQLVELEWNVVIVDKLAGEHNELIEYYQDTHRVPLIKGDATIENNLMKANILKARALMVLIDDDLLNLKIAMKARKINPDIHIVLRMFDTEFGRLLADELNFSLFSTTKIAVDAFVGDLRKLS